MASATPLKIESPLSPDVIARLRTGDRLLITGILYAARDAAHQRMLEALERGDKLPFDIKGQTLYYMGPSPSPPGKVIGAAGPTTSGRMDGFTPRLLQEGLKVMIGKGSRSKEVKAAMKRYGAIYLAATGGAGALLSRTVRGVEVIAYSDLGPEAVHRLEVQDFPAIVVNDICGGDLYEEGRAKYAAQADFESIAGILGTEGKLSKALLRERGLDKRRESRARSNRNQPVANRRRMKENS